MDEVFAQFGSGTAQRQAVTAGLRGLMIWPGAHANWNARSLWAAYITAKPDPNDVDITLVMRDDFDVQACNEESRPLLTYSTRAEAFSASVFWIRPALLVLETLEEFIAHWDIMRDQTRRGIVEVRA